MQVRFCYSKKARNRGTKKNAYERKKRRKDKGMTQVTEVKVMFENFILKTILINSHFSIFLKCYAFPDLRNFLLNLNLKYLLNALQSTNKTFFHFQDLGKQPHLLPAS